MKPLREGAIKRKTVKPNKTKEDKIMTPARTNQNWLPGIFNEILGDNWLAERRSTTAPAVNIIDGENEYKVEVAAPGMTKEDFKVHINEDNELVISLEKKTENKEEDTKRKGTYLRREFSYTQFQQSLLLPDNIERENISAKVENGVMTIDIPKKKIEETAAATRQIEVK
jgi:HSP20 family protein